MLHLTTLLLFALTPCSVGLQRFIVTFRHQAEPAPSSHKPLSSIVDNVCNLNSNTSCALTCLHTFHGGCAYGFAARFRNRSSLHAFVHQCIGFDMIKDIEADVPTESTANRNQLQVPCNATPSELGNETQWSLRRTTNRLDDSKGSGVNIYVLDSGIRASHVEFTSKDGNSSRAILAYDAITSSNIAFSSDADGHGTHVASNAGGATAGLAKNASLIGVRVLNKRGRGRVGNALAGLDYIAMAQSQNNRPAVINMSLGVPRQLLSRTLSAAVTSISQNTTVIVASGNVREVSSCSITPAFLDSVLTVSASNIENKPYNASSLGECVDLFGPGEKVSTWQGFKSIKDKVNH
jgi:subtilisin family serine protease